MAIAEWKRTVATRVSGHYSARAQLQTMQSEYRRVIASHEEITNP
jgi:hypothetical protein